jgi:hypothetical protein
MPSTAYRPSRGSSPANPATHGARPPPGANMKAKAETLAGEGEARQVMVTGVNGSALRNFLCEPKARSVKNVALDPGSCARDIYGDAAGPGAFFVHGTVQARRHGQRTV